MGEALGQPEQLLGIAIRHLGQLLRCQAMQRCDDLGDVGDQGGVATFKNAERVRSVIASMDLSKLLLETDCPYMAPVPFRGKINHSALIPYIAEVIAPLHGLTVEELAEVTGRNAEELFGLSKVLSQS